MELSEAVKELDAKIQNIVINGWSKNTLKTRNSQWSRYLNFCQEFSLIPLPATDRTVVRFLMYQSQTSTYVTVNNYLSAIVTLHKFFGYTSDFRDSFLVKMFLNGLANTLGKKVKQKHPLTVSNLFEMYAKLDLSCSNNITLWCACVLGFRTLLRKSNIVPENVEDFSHCLRRGDVKFSKNGILLTVKSTKTLKYYERELLIPLNFIKGSPLCVASMLNVHIAMCPKSGDAPLFWLWGEKSKTWRVLLYKDLLCFIKKCISSIGLKDNDFGTHSLRRGGAQFLQAQGVSLVDLQFIGDWRSFAVMHYLVTPMDRRQCIEDSVSSNLSKMQS